MPSPSTDIPLTPTSSGSVAASYRTARSVFPYRESLASIRSTGIRDLAHIPIVAVMGPAGAGKSTFIKVATGMDDVRIKDMPGPYSQRIQTIQGSTPSRNSHILFIDTPGFGDTQRTDTEILEQLANWLQETYRDGTKLSGILYLHRITDNRVFGTLLRNLDLVLKLCGSNALSNVTLVTTHWDQLQNIEEGIRSEEELRNNHWKPLLAGGSQMMRFEHTVSSAWSVINSLPMVQMPLEIQREMVDQGKSLADTVAGRSLFIWFHQVIEALKEFIRRLESLIKKFTSSTKHGLEDIQRERALKEAMASLREIETQRARLRSRRRRSDPGSVRSSNESSLSGDSNTSGSSWRYIVHKIYDRPEGSLRRRLSRRSSQHHGSTMIQAQSVGPNPPQVLSNVVGDVPDANSFREAATGIDAGPSASELTYTIQTLKLARAAITGTPLPGLEAAVEIALRVAESLNDIRDTHLSLFTLINNVSQFAKAICDSAQPTQHHAEEVNDAIEEFGCQLRRVEQITKKINKSNILHPYVLQPDDICAIIDCNDAIKFALRTLGIHVASTIAAENENTYAKLIKLERLVTTMVTTYAERERKRLRTSSESNEHPESKIRHKTAQNQDTLLDVPDIDSFIEVATGLGAAPQLYNLTEVTRALEQVATNSQEAADPSFLRTTTVALRLAESLKKMGPDPNLSLVLILNNVARLFDIMRIQRKAVDDHGGVIKPIEAFRRELLRMLEITRQIRTGRTRRRCLLHPDDQEAMYDCNKAMELILVTQGVAARISSTRQTENIFAKMARVESTITRSITDYAQHVQPGQTEAGFMT